MTLIDSQEFHALANALGTALFIFTVLWALWFASRMD